MKRSPKRPSSKAEGLIQSEAAPVLLSGQLIANPSPNITGFWAFRKLADGTLLSTELTREEWQEIHRKGQQG